MSPVAISSRQPEPGALGASSRPYVTFALTGDVLTPVYWAEVSVEVSGAWAVIAGRAQPGFDVSHVDNGALFGVEATIRPRRPLDPEVAHGLRVTARDLDSSWSFTVGDVIGPHLANVTPVDGSDSQPGFPIVEFDVVDDSTGVVRLRSAQAVDADASWSGNQLTCPTIDCRDLLGRLFDVDGTLAFVTHVAGHHVVFVDTGGSGTGLTATLFADAGLDVTLAGARVVRTGVVVSGQGWDVAVTEPTAGVRHVRAKKTTAPLDNGQRVDIHVRARDDSDDFDNVGDLRSHFYVGDIRGPRVALVTPEPGSRGVSTSAHVTFAVVDAMSGVSQASIAIKVGGLAAVTAGTPVGVFSTSTLVARSGGFDVTLINAGPWADGSTQTVTVDASDLVGNAMSRVCWFLGFGATASTQVSAGAAPVRVAAFDLAGSSFARPVDMGHTGFAADGYGYYRGARDGTRASWALESASGSRSSRQTFPLSGYLIASAASWRVTDATGALWMSCTALGSGTAASWSLAGGADQALTDASWAAGAACLALAAGAGVIVVDFAADSAWRLTASGRETVGAGLDMRDADQAAGSELDTDYALAATGGDFQRLSLLRWDQNWLVAAARGAQLELVGDIDDDFRALVHELREGQGDFSGHVVLVPLAGAAGGTWARVAMIKRDPDAIEPLVAGYTTAGGEARLVSLDWLGTFAHLHAEIATISTPLATAAMADLEQVVDEDGNHLVAVAQADAVRLLVVDDVGGSAALEKTVTLAGLQLDSVSGGALSAVALGTGFSRQRGHLYAAASAGSDGKVVRYRHQPATASASGQVFVADNGRATASVASMGRIEDAGRGYIRGRMAVKTRPDHSDIAFVDVVDGLSIFEDQGYTLHLEVTDAVDVVTFSVVSGVLPTGITLNATTGVVSGSATNIPDELGIHIVTFGASDGVGTATLPLALTVVDFPSGSWDFEPDHNTEGIGEIFVASQDPFDQPQPGNYLVAATTLLNGIGTWPEVSMNAVGQQALFETQRTDFFGQAFTMSMDIALRFLFVPQSHAIEVFGMFFINQGAFHDLRLFIGPTQVEIMPTGVLDDHAMHRVEIRVHQNRMIDVRIDGGSWDNKGSIGAFISSTTAAFNGTFNSLVFDNISISKRTL